MTKGADAFRSIGEVARLLGVAPHVLRYWETQFPLLRPMKRADGRRYYRPDDVRLAAGLCIVLRDEGLTIRGAKKLLARDRGASVRERGHVRLTQITEGAGPGDQDPWLAPDPVEDEAESPPAHEPRSRRRLRPHAGAKTQPPGLLAEVVALNVRLRDLRPADAAMPHQRASLARLRDALARIC